MVLLPFSLNLYKGAVAWDRDARIALRATSAVRMPAPDLCYGFRMIVSVQIENLRCIRAATIDFAPLTVLVGSNASGKSTVLEALAPQRALTLRDVWMRRPAQVSIVVAYTGGRIGRRLLQHPGGAENLQLQHSFQLLRLDLAQLRRANTLARQERLTPAGDNLANVFATLTRKQQTSLGEELSRLVPVVSDVDVEPTQHGDHQLRFQDRWSPDIWYAPNEVSDGTILMTAFLTLQYQQPPIDLLVIEEPDRGLHPYLVSQLVAFLRKLSTGEVGGKPIQVVMATHSAELLDYVRPEEVRFLNRNRETGALEVHKVDPNSPDWQATYNEYRESLGSLWLSGGLGGVPGE